MMMNSRYPPPCPPDGGMKKELSVNCGARYCTLVSKHKPVDQFKGVITKSVRFCSRSNS